MGARRRRGFTLTELLVVVLIVTLVSAIALPTIIPALTSRQIGESARILQAAIAGARDAAIKANAPRGIRLLPDKLLSSLKQDPNTGLMNVGNFTGQVLTASRIVPIEPAPDLVDSSVNGSATFHTLFNNGTNGGTATWMNATNSTTGLPNPPVFPFPVAVAAANRGVYPMPGSPQLASGSTTGAVLMVVQAMFQLNGKLGTIANPPTNWFWNVRIGDKIRFQESGHYYTIVGPMTMPNPESFVNDGPPQVSPYNSNTNMQPTFSDTYGNAVTGPINVRPEYLFLVNGVDDNVDGFADPGVDGVNQSITNNGPTYSAYPDSIFDWTEFETWLGSQAQTAMFSENVAGGFPPTFAWTIVRRPVPSPGAREISLAAGATIDLTTWDTTMERSRLPVDPFSGNVDVLLNQAGQVIPTTYYSTPSSVEMAGAFYHFWITDRGDVTAPTGTSYPSLPIGSDFSGALPKGQSLANPPFLKKDRMLLTLFARTGHVVTTSLQNFNVNDVNRPYDDAQLGIREAK